MKTIIIGKNNCKTHFINNGFYTHLIIIDNLSHMDISY